MVVRLRKVLKIIAVTDTRWAGRGVIPTQFLRGPLRVSEIKVDRRISRAAKNNDTYHEVGNVRSDTKRVVDFFVGMQWLLMEYGVSLPQATYVAAASAIDVLCVSGGIDPGVGVPGLMPEDVGFVLPASLPGALARS